MAKILIQTIAMLLAILVTPISAKAQSADTESIAVCVDVKKASSCMQGDALIQSLFGLRPRTELGWKIRNDLYVNAVLGKLIQEGESPSALFIIEEITPDTEDSRPQCHACVPRMTIALLDWVGGAWKLVSHTKGLKGIGSWGKLNVNDLALHVAGSKQYLIEIRSAYMNQGIIETTSGFYASFEPSGTPSSAIRELGSVITSVSSCASGFDESAQENAQLAIFFKPKQYPDLILYKTQASCDDTFFMATMPPQIYIFDNKSNAYSLSDQKKDR